MRTSELDCIVVSSRGGSSLGVVGLTKTKSSRGGIGIQREESKRQQKGGKHESLTEVMENKYGTWKQACVVWEIGVHNQRITASPHETRGVCRMDAASISPKYLDGLTFCHRVFIGRSSGTYLQKILEEPVSDDPLSSSRLFSKSCGGISLCAFLIILPTISCTITCKK